MTNQISSTNVAAMVGIVGCSWMAGGGMALSTLAMPGLLAASRVPPQALARQWQVVFDRGKATMPAVALAAMLGYAYLAFERGARGLEWRGFAAAGALDIAIVPFTLAVMRSTNHALIAVARGKDEAMSEEGVKAVIVRWRWMNMVRSFWPLAAAVVGSWSLLE